MKKHNYIQAPLYPRYNNNAAAPPKRLPCQSKRKSPKRLYSTAYDSVDSPAGLFILAAATALGDNRPD